MNKKISNFIVDNPRMLLCLSIVIIFIAAIGISKIWITNDFKVFFEPDSTLIQSLNKLDEEYSQHNSVFFVVGAKEGSDVFDRETLQVIERLTKKSWELPYAKSVDSLVNYQHSQSAGEELLVGSMLEDPGAMSQKDIDRARSIYLDHPLVTGRLVDKKGNVTFVMVTFNINDAFSEEPKVAEAANLLLEELRRDHPAVPLFLTGQIMGNQAFADAVVQDMLTITPLTYGLIIALMSFMLRSVVATMISLLVVTLSTVFAVGVHGWIDGMVNPIVGFAPYMILTIAVADCIHIYSIYFRERGLGLDVYSALQKSISINLQPIVLTSITTAIGFMCMHFSDSPPFRVLGTVVALGVMAALFLSLVFLPAMIQLLPDTKRYSPPRGSDFMKKLSSVIIQYPRRFSVVTLVVVCILMSGISKNTVDDNFVHYFDDTFEFRQANDYVNDYLPGMHSIHYDLKAKGENGITDIEYLTVLDNFKQWYSQQPTVGYVESFSDTIKQLNKNMHNDDQSFYRLPENKELASQYLLIYEISLPFGHDLTSRVNFDKSATKMTVNTWSTTSSQILALENNAQKWLRTNGPEYMFTTGASMDIVFSSVSNSNVVSMLKGSFIAMLLISVVLIFALRSIKLGLLSLVPNILPAVTAFGVWGFADGRIGLAVSVVACMTLGIVVDDTIHFISKYNYARKTLKSSPEDAIVYAFNTVGVALLITSVVFVAGFGIMSLSHYLGNAQMGLLTAITITIALLADFLLLPVLLLFVDRSRGEI